MAGRAAPMTTRGSDPSVAPEHGRPAARRGSDPSVTAEEGRPAAERGRPPAERPQPLAAEEAGPVVAAGPRTIDLRPLFAPRSIAVVGASPRNWIAQVVRDNLRVMGSETRCYSRLPLLASSWGAPSWPAGWGQHRP